jgi:NAD(P)-dependent dehydrogenase (short-subunit alcohol dehydrogenase family)
MELAGKVVVVTGGASGIGRALAERFAAEGAAGMVVADRNAAGAAAVADDIGRAHPGRVLGLACNVAVEAEVVGLIARTEQVFGPVDLFCANAGVAVGTGLDTPDAEWDTALAVNVRAHVYAARHLVPGWVARGEGYFLATASAAGLLTQIGSAPYAVSKHAAVAFAEWLSVTYGDQGVRVSCLCPMGVNTAMLGASDGSSIASSGAAAVRTSGLVLEPAEVAEQVVAALRDERFLVLPHPEVLTFFQRKASDYDRWLAGMRRLQARVGGGA